MVRGIRLNAEGLEGDMPAESMDMCSVFFGCALRRFQ